MAPHDLQVSKVWHEHKELLDLDGDVREHEVNGWARGRLRQAGRALHVVWTCFSERLEGGRRTSPTNPNGINSTKAWLSIRKPSMHRSYTAPRGRRGEPGAPWDGAGIGDVCVCVCVCVSASAALLDSQPRLSGPVLGGLHTNNVGRTPADGHVRSAWALARARRVRKKWLEAGPCPPRGSVRARGVTFPAL